MKKKIIGIVLIALTLSALTFWELWGRINLTYDTILVLTETVSENTIITSGMLKEKRVDSASKEALRVKDMTSIIGKETKHMIPAGAELYSIYFTEPRLAVGGNTGRYILSIPKEWLRSYPQTLKRGDTAIFYLNSEFILSATVAFVRDSSNQEVDFSKERLMSTSTVSLIEIVVTEEEAKKIGGLADEGYKFVILYC